jgi:hypothetical protein
MKIDKRKVVLIFISSFAFASIIGYVSVANAQNMTASINMTSNTSKGISQNNTGIGTAKQLENLTGNNTQQFNNSALSNFTTGISEKISNFTGNNSALSNFTTGISEKISNFTGNHTGNQSGNQS